MAVKAIRLLAVLGSRFVAEESGQDLIEYALLSATIGLAGAGVWEAIRNGIGTAYTYMDGQAYGLWQSPDPQ